MRVLASIVLMLDVGPLKPTENKMCKITLP